MFNLATILRESAKKLPEKPAIIFNDQSFTYTQLEAVSNQVANGLKAIGIQPGDKVALSCPNLPYFPIIYYGILKVGAVVVPLNVLFKRREIAYHLEDSDAKAYFCFVGTPELPMGQEGWEGFKRVDTCEHFFLITPSFSDASPLEGAQTLGQLIAHQPPTTEMVYRSPEDTAVILYTSGTTGHPKGAELSHSNMFMNAQVVRNMLEAREDDVHLITLPLFHSFGQTVQMNTGIYSGNTLVLIPRFDPGVVLHNLQKHEVTIFCGVPTMYWALLSYPEAEKYNLKKIAQTLRLGVSGGASLPMEVLKQFEQKFNIEILEGYGLSETSPVATFNQLHKERKAGSIGLPVWGVEVKVVDEAGNELPPGETGEIVIRGHNVMKGYYKRPVETEKVFRNGWFHTGDVGRMDEDGYFYIVDRIKDMIIRGGYNVYPREIEEVLMTHPAVSLAAVIGVPHERYGEEIKAYLVLKEGAKATPEEILAWAKEELADYKYPRLIEIRDSLPITATGKILKKELRKEVRGEA